MDINVSKALCFSGHRSERLPKTPEEQSALKQALSEAIDMAVAAGIDVFITGACYGFDLMAAMQVHNRRCVTKPGDPPHMKLIAVVPFAGQADHWKEQDQRLYFNTLLLCDEVITLHAYYKSGCYHERNRWLVDHSGTMICFYDGGRSGTGYTVSYGEKSGLSITNLYKKLY